MSDSEAADTVHSADDRAAYWQPHIEAWQASGLSAKRFCSQHSLPYGQFLYWSRKQCEPTASNALPSAFARVVPVMENRASGLTVHLPGGIRISGIDADNVALVSALLAQL